MSSYYYSEDGKQIGPFTIEELQTKRIQKDTLVWKEGTTNWHKAEDLPELKDIFSSTASSTIKPPPLPTSPQKNTEQKGSKHIFKKIILNICFLIGLIALTEAVYYLFHPNVFGNYSPMLPKTFMIAAVLLIITFVFSKNKKTNTVKETVVLKREIRGRVSNFTAQQLPKGKGFSSINWSFNIIRFDENDKPLPKVPVQLKGYQISGFITEGDDVGISGNWTPPQTLQIKKLFNYSTNSIVQVNTINEGFGKVFLTFFVIVFVVILTFFVYAILKNTNIIK